MLNTAIRIFTIVALAGLLVGCSGDAGGRGGKTTCAEWWAISLPTKDQIYGKRNKQQDEIAKKMLKDNGYDGGYAGNLDVAEMNIDQFCGYDWARNTQNANRPIEDAVFGP